MELKYLSSDYELWSKVKFGVKYVEVLVLSGKQTNIWWSSLKYLKSDKWTFCAGKVTSRAWQCTVDIFLQFCLQCIVDHAKLQQLLLK